jgi:hypothetical protein
MRNLDVFLTSACFAVLLAVSSGCHSRVQRIDVLPKLGEHLAAPEGTQLIAVSPSQLYPYITRAVAGLSYIVAFDRDHAVTYIQPASQEFLTPEQLRTGSTLRDVLAAGGSEIRNERGWYRYSILPSGWRAAFPANDAELTPESKVSTFFMRR